MHKQLPMPAHVVRLNEQFGIERELDRAVGPANSDERCAATD
jgi:hypothetical protein